MTIKSFIDRTRSGSVSYLVPLTSYFLLCVLYLSLSACDEVGVAIETPLVTSLGFQSRVKDPLSFQVFINDELFDSHYPNYPYIKYHQRDIQARIMETPGGRVIFDGLFPLSPASRSAYLTVYQYEHGSIPVCILPPQEESLPPAGFSKIAFLYNFPDFPEEIKVIVENTTTDASFTYEPTDTLIVRKNEFSGFFLGRVRGMKTQVRLYTTGDNSTQIGVIGSSQFTFISNDFTMYLANGKSGTGGNQQITFEKAY